MILLVIDCQNGLVTPDLYQYDIFCHRVKALISAARSVGTEVVFIRHSDGPGAPLSPGNPAYEISPLFTPKPHELIFDKTRNSPFRKTGLLKYLRTKKEKSLMITGLQTEYCIDATVKCGYEQGFRILVPEYANSTVDNAHMTAEATYEYYNQFIWKGRYAECISFADAIRLVNPR
ncbi:MAG: cysteine hydrolase [Clostridiales bacterium]|nr:cysteine hydrolase [Clostridiales bacterium]